MPTAKKSQNKNPELLVLALIMLVNALSYGTIIPLLYPYASRFGIDPLGLSLLFATYSTFQFIFTPILGRLSDRYGRKPLLIFSIFGTSISLALFASAQSLPMLFVARGFDGITGGNVSVAQAMIADKVEEKKRAQVFGMLGAAFGFGFLIGPALGGILSSYGLAVPFWFGSGLALIATLASVIFLKESLTKKNRKKQNSEPLFNFTSLFKALFNPLVGSILAVGLVAAIAQNVFIIGFETYSVDALLLDPRQRGILFSIAGLMTIVMQAAGIKWLLKVFKSKSRIVKYSFFSSFVALLIMSLSLSFQWFVAIMLLYMVTHSAIVPMVSALLSERTNPEDQGAMLGINQSYTSLGQILGPLSAGIVSQISTTGIFIWSAVLMLIGFVFVQFKGQNKAKVNI